MGLASFSPSNKRQQDCRGLWHSAKPPLTKASCRNLFPRLTVTQLWGLFATPKTKAVYDTVTFEVAWPCQHELQL